MREAFFALMELPADDVDHIDPGAVLDLKMILAEMNETKARMDALMGEYARTPRSEEMVRSTSNVKKGV